MKYVGNKSFMMFNNKMMELMELIKFRLSVFQISNSTNKKLPKLIDLLSLLMLQTRKSI